MSSVREKLYDHKEIFVLGLAKSNNPWEREGGREREREAERHADKPLL